MIRNENGTGKYLLLYQNGPRIKNGRHCSGIFESAEGIIQVFSKGVITLAQAVFFHV